MGGPISVEDPRRRHRFWLPGAVCNIGRRAGRCRRLRRQQAERGPLAGRHDALRGHRLQALYVCALTVGLRRGKLLGLAWSDIDFDTGTLTVRQTSSVPRAGCRSWHPRRSGPGGLFRCRRRLSSSFRAHRRQQAADRLAAGERWQDHGLVFASKVGTPVDPDHIDRTWHKIRASAGLDWLRLHDLRHACATFLLVSGASPRTVMKGAGHRQIGLAMNTHAHGLPAIEREAVADAAKHLFG
ncbi:tyrosine-type recombinase/integrase [Micromonospora sp. KC213]|uniref:tyrosine-type recombinase/integrase n=1 Tax=Micromonospora sp. KC213 TaxID=2530378 RepID=UPI001051218E|nr:tyrosine-type recombinase/integrase [Micromonospora sp. KC213]TDC37980.1 site-specific integrase [Micromonospora sp. KC213]